MTLSKVDLETKIKVITSFCLNVIYHSPITFLKVLNGSVINSDIIIVSLQQGIYVFVFHL